MGFLEDKTAIITGRNKQKLTDAKEELERLYNIEVLPVQANMKMPPAGHYGNVEKEIGRVCVQLASPDFKYLNGETLTLEGGMGLRP